MDDYIEKEILRQIKINNLLMLIVINKLGSSKSTIKVLKDLEEIIKDSAIDPDRVGLTFTL